MMDDVGQQEEAHSKRQEADQQGGANEHQLILALRLTEEVLAFVESAHSPHLDWPVIAHHLAPYRRPALTPRECRALWRKLAYRNSNNGSSSSSSHTTESDRGEPQLQLQQQQQHNATGGPSEGDGDDMQVEEVRRDEDTPHTGAGGRGKKRRSKDGHPGPRRRRDADPGAGETPAPAEAAATAGDMATPAAEKRPRLGGDHQPSVGDEAEESSAAAPAARAGRSNPLGTPQQQEPPAEAAGDAQGHKGPRKRVLWTNEEDFLLVRGVQRNGEGNWAAILRDQAEGSLLLRRNSTQLAQRWNAIKRKIQRAHYAGLDEATKALAMELILSSSSSSAAAGPRVPSPPSEAAAPAGDGEDVDTAAPTTTTTPSAAEEPQQRPPPPGEQPFHQALPGPSRVFD